MLIKGIHCLGHLMPIAGKNYAIARITSVDGTLPDELAQSTYTVNGINIERVTVAPSELGYEDSICENLMALYVLE